MLEPEASRVRAASPVPGAPLTADIGYYHVAKVEGRTSAELKSAVTKFSAALDELGLQITVLSTRRYSYSLWTSQRVGIEVVYAVGPMQIDARRRPAGAPISTN